MSRDKGLDRIIENEFLQQRKVNMKVRRYNKFLEKYITGKFKKDRAEEKKIRKQAM